MYFKVGILKKLASIKKKPSAKQHGNISVPHVGLETKKINAFLIKNKLRIINNPAISPDQCLDSGALFQQVEDEWDFLKTIFHGARSGESYLISGELRVYPVSKLTFQNSDWYVVESTNYGDCGICSGFEEGEFIPKAIFQDEHIDKKGLRFAPLTWNNLVLLKNYLYQADPNTTVFPSAKGSLQKTSLGIGARFTAMHWPAVAWAMSHLKLSLTANQNSIPRELVYNVDVMLANKLQEVPFPFIGRGVPEGHQGQSVQGMSGAAILTYLKYGFHLHHIPWGFNADHQPIGGRFDAIENDLVQGSLFASYITFDLSPELSVTPKLEDEKKIEAAFKKIDATVVKNIQHRLKELHLSLDLHELKSLLTYLHASMDKLKKRDDKYKAIREKVFSVPEATTYYRELSIDELPGETTPATLAVCLAYAEALDLKFNFIAPNIGFQKNLPYPDNLELERKVTTLFEICQKFGVAFGFHSASGKSAENYQILGKVTSGALEIKTSGRYTYEMGKALSHSAQKVDQDLWHDWYEFTREVAFQSAYSKNETQKTLARDFIEKSIHFDKKGNSLKWEDKAKIKKSLWALKPNPDHPLWFEYNFLYILAAGGSVKKLGDHTPAGYKQRKRFYEISPEARLHYAKGVARYILFLSENTSICSPTVALEARRKLESYHDYIEFLKDISP